MAQHPKPFIAGSSAVSKTKMDIPIIKNPKYGNIQSLVETGVSKAPKEDPLLHRRLKKQYSDDIFKKMKISTFVALILDLYKNSTNIKGTVESAAEDREVTKECSQSDSCFSKLITGIGEMDIHQEGRNSVARPMKHDLPLYLLLDVRSYEDFTKDHIITAKNYPHTMTMRAFNYETKDLVQYKYEKEKFIILYDEHEELSQKVCNILSQRGYDNIYILRGGFAKSREMFPSGLTVRTSKYNFPETTLLRGGDSPATCPSKDDRVKSGDLKAEEFHPEDIATLQEKIDCYYGSKGRNISNVHKDHLDKLDCEDPEKGQVRENTRNPRSKMAPWK